MGGEHRMISEAGAIQIAGRGRILITGIPSTTTEGSLDTAANSIGIQIPTNQGTVSTPTEVARAEAEGDTVETVQHHPRHPTAAVDSIATARDRPQETGIHDATTSSLSISTIRAIEGGNHFEIKVKRDTAMIERTEIEDGTEASLTARVRIDEIALCSISRISTKMNGLRISCTTCSRATATY
mmetsp:Transcript_6272/g.15120  ORF Transcript_6272/g.15120 Transcript_6272/m.15120 type:complete len:184 (-) Transcript_6272:1214-1765(-)